MSILTDIEDIHLEGLKDFVCISHTKEHLYGYLIYDKKYGIKGVVFGTIVRLINVSVVRLLT